MRSVEKKTNTTQEYVASEGRKGARGKKTRRGKRKNPDGTKKERKRDYLEVTNITHDVLADLMDNENGTAKR